LSIFFLLGFFFQGKKRHLFGPGYIRVLGRLIAATQQDYDFVPGIFVIHPVTGAVVDTHFRTTSANRLNIAGISFLKPVYPVQNMGLGYGVPKFFEPFPKNGRFAYLHTYSVIQNLQIVKGERLFFNGFFGIFPGAAPFGYFPYQVNAGGVIHSGGASIAYRLDSGPSKPHFSRFGGNFKGFPDFINRHAVHNIIFGEKNTEIYQKYVIKVEQVIDNSCITSVTCFYQFHSILFNYEWKKGDRNMKGIIEKGLKRRFFVEKEEYLGLGKYVLTVQETTPLAKGILGYLYEKEMQRPGLILLSWQYGRGMSIRASYVSTKNPKTAYIKIFDIGKNGELIELVSVRRSSKTLFKCIQEDEEICVPRYLLEEPESVSHYQETMALPGYAKT
jgi:hypothetical protein